MLAEVEARLKGQCPTLRLVEGAAGMAALDGKAPAQRPAAYVIPIRETAGQNAVAMAVRQRVAVTFGVVIAHGNRRDARGEAASRELEAIESEVMAAVLGWQPANGYEACTYARTATVLIRDGVVWRLQEYATETRISAPETSG